MGALPPVQEIIFEVQSKMNNEKIARRKINFSTYKTCFFFFFSFLWTFLLSKLQTFSFFIHLLNGLCHRNVTFNFTNHL
jgi:hypothetical protein